MGKPATTTDGLRQFAFRFNRRTSRARGLLRRHGRADSDRIPSSELIGGTGNDRDEPTDGYSCNCTQADMQ